ncbi:MAG: hypothetical protein WAK01_14675 [Methylocystis sp.]
MRSSMMAGLLLLGLLTAFPHSAAAGLAKPSPLPDAGGGALGIALAGGVVYLIRRSRKDA